MDHTTLPIDLEDTLATLRRWVECESPTFDAAAVNRMMDVATRDLAMEGARVERIPGRMGFGDCVRATLPGSGAGPAVLVMAHLDTVHPVGTLAALPWRQEAGFCYGPGIVDMKGGMVAALAAISALRRAGLPMPPVTVLLTSDEEVGSPSTRDLIEAEGQRHGAVLVPEPAREDGGVVTGRYAIARFDLRATGRPSHAGARLGDGRPAISAMARRVLAIEAMTTPDCTFSVGVIQGGQWVNCVATTCVAEALSMAKRQPDLDRGVAQMLALSGVENEVRFEVTRGVTRPVWESTDGTMALYAKARAAAQALGFDIGHGSAGGGSDGNFTGALGIPTLDSLGVRGTGIHTLEERMAVDSLGARARMFAGLLTALA